MADTECPCCGETYEYARDSDEVVCACEWDGCDENCPHVGHLFKTTPGTCTRDDCDLPTVNDDVCWWCRNADAGSPLASKT